MADDEPKQRFIEQGSHKGKGIAVFTSGGDSPGKIPNDFYNVEYFQHCPLFYSMFSNCIFIQAEKPLFFSRKVKHPLSIVYGSYASDKLGGGHRNIRQKQNHS